MVPGTRKSSLVAFKHIALHVPDMRAAEEHYRTIFAAELVGREAPLEDGRWYSAPHGTGWPEIESAGLEIGWIGLRRDDLRIALLSGEPDPDRTLYCIGVTTTAAEREEMRERLPTDVTIEVDSPSGLTFVDRYGFRWQCSDAGFGTAGDIRGDWLDI
jgi:catechol 2,3-dioxygenase-like lactoylglutathione lyase family enzyme